MTTRRAKAEQKQRQLGWLKTYNEKRLWLTIRTRNCRLECPNLGRMNRLDPLFRRRRRMLLRMLRRRLGLRLGGRELLGLER